MVHAGDGGQSTSVDHTDSSADGSKKGKKMKKKKKDEDKANSPETRDKSAVRTEEPAAQDHETKDRPLSVTVCVPEGRGTGTSGLLPVEEIPASPEKHKVTKRKL